MEINFKNGSSITSLESYNEIQRGKRANIAPYFDYWERCPDKFVEYVTGQKLSFWKKMLLKIQLKKGNKNEGSRFY